MSPDAPVFEGTRMARGLDRALLPLFLGALVLHFALVTGNWRAGFLPGHEFRQTHTAIIADYIDREDNFSPIYTVPLFGKPWVCPMEFPLYEWSVVGLSRATGWPHHVAARTVTLASFYLMLPALYLLLGDAGLAPRRRLPALGLVLCCPVYIFYSRSFLMESMTLAGAAWFLAGFVRTMRERRIGWLVVCALGGAVSGLVKSTTFFVWLVPAMAYGAYCLARSWRERGGSWTPVLRTVGWGLAAAALPCGSVYWWVRYSDLFKVDHPSAYIFASKNLSQGNFGLLNLGARFSPDTWRTLLERWHEAIGAPWLVGGVTLAGLALFPRERGRIGAAAGLFLMAQLLFPFAYALQEYYFYACAVFLMAALGFVVTGVLDAPWRRGVRVASLIALLLLPLALVANYRRVYRELQMVPSNGGTGLTQALRAVTPPGSVIVVIGQDWAPATAYYSQRKALMVRRGLEFDRAYLERAFADLADESVSALVMAGEHRDNAELAGWIASKLGLDGSPTFSHPTANVHVSSLLREHALFLLTTGVGGASGYEGIVARGRPSTLRADAEIVAIPAALAATSFDMIKPAVSHVRFSYGYARWDLDGTWVLGAHPDTDLWVPVPPGRRRLTWEYGIFPAAHARPGESTGGVEFVAYAEAADGTRRRLFQRALDPAGEARDRGVQRTVLEIAVAAGESLLFQTRPHGGAEFDWAYVRRIEVN
ncbi:MAG TPA: hypothetical protein VEB66_03450 [Opitutaceae bacterium]|nr:hypothetical protein [Opitutaceae bacterium]